MFYCPGVQAPELIPATGAWREGDPVGHRQFFEAGPVDLEAGGHLPQVIGAFETWGQLNEAGDNAVLVLHSLTGDSHIRGRIEPGHPTAGWWTDLIGPGAPLDVEKYFIVAPNVLGGCQGTTGPSSTAPDGKPWGSRFPFLTVRDTVEVELRLTDYLGIGQWALVIGGSLGGMRTLEWAASYPGRVRRAVPIATTAQTSADQIAWAHTQLAAIQLDPNFLGGDYYSQPDGQGPHQGFSIARQIAQTTYRSALEFERRFGQLAQDTEDPWSGGRYAIQSYLEHHGRKLVHRFDTNSYKVLTEAFMSHDVGRGRGGVEQALATITADTLVVAVDSDRLCLPEEGTRIAEGIPNCRGRVLVQSSSGHDGFLLEFDQFGPLIEEFLSG